MVDFVRATPREWRHGLSVGTAGAHAAVQALEARPAPERAAGVAPQQIVARPGPQAAFETIARSRFVITGRYHGMIFARVSRVPFITPVDSPYKVRMEKLDEDMTAAAGHFEVLRRFVS